MWPHLLFFLNHFRLHPYLLVIVFVIKSEALENGFFRHFFFHFVLLDNLRLLFWFRRGENEAYQDEGQANGERSKTRQEPGANPEGD